MKEYHKIVTLFKRDPETKFKRVIDGEFATPEFEYLKDLTWQATEKVDGTNIRVMWDGAKVTFGGKTDRAQLYAPLIERLQGLFYEGLMSVVFGESPACIYGEGFGARIQKGGGNYIPDGVDFTIFDVLVGDTWLRREDVEDVANKSSCSYVPVVYEGNIAGAVELVKSGMTSTWGEFVAEGIVLRPAVELKNRLGNRVISKLKVSDFEAVTPK